MIREELKQLFEIDKCALAVNSITQDLMENFDDFVLNNLAEQNFMSEILTVYKRFVPMKQNAPQGMKMELFNTIKNFAQEQIDNQNYIPALVLYRFLMVKSELIPYDYAVVANTLALAGAAEIGGKFINIYSKKENNPALKFLECADFYKKIKNYKQAIECYEKYTRIDSTKSVIYTIMADLYAKAYGQEAIQNQLDCYLQAYSLKPDNRLALHGLAFLYEKISDNANARKFYEKLLENNPTEIDYYNYGMFLIHCGEIYEGHKFLTHRFNIEDVNLKYPAPEPKWNLKSDITDKTLLIHYEQGFGDTIMYCRFVPLLKKYAKKIIFVVQDELCELIKNSTLISEGIEVVSDKTYLNTLQFDCTMALLDAPYVLKSSPETIPFKDKYLSAEPDLGFSNEKLKIGIAYSGDKSANYHGRDMELSDFAVLNGLENCQIYSFQKGEDSADAGIINLVNNFDNFIQTAQALMSMDIVISTDNVILNLAGALSVKTYALFNKETNFRWFKTVGDDVCWYNSVRPVQFAQDGWTPILDAVKG